LPVQEESKGGPTPDGCYDFRRCTGEKELGGAAYAETMTQNEFEAFLLPGGVTSGEEIVFQQMGSCR